MSIIINNLSYCYPNQYPLFSQLHFSVISQAKVSLIGNNGTGKSTLLQLIANYLQPVEGNIVCSSKPYYIPQQITCKGKTVGDALGIADKLNAMQAILKGSTNPMDYDILDDNWDIEAQTLAALYYWKLTHIKPSSLIDNLSGGEKTKIFLAGLLIHKPDIILLDEPTNHLDVESRELLYEFIRQSNATIIVVSHDITLLNLLDTTYELSSKGIRLYGGNYDFYKEQKAIEENALHESIQNKETNLRLAKKKAQEVKERQEKRNQQGEKNKDQVIPILRKTVLNRGQNTSARLNEKHTEIISDSQEQLKELRNQKGKFFDLKIDLEDTQLHKGKLLISAKAIQYEYIQQKPLWITPLDFELYSGDRVYIKGNNGSGKTTFVKLLIKELIPTSGKIECSVFSYVYLEQTYAQVNVNLTVLELAQQHNAKYLQDHELKLRLSRALFPANAWDKNCMNLSGGEKMRLYLCCILLSNQIPDLFILDEPTNNLDVSSLEILIETIKQYRGTLLVISHDKYFVKKIGVDKNILLH